MNRPSPLPALSTRRDFIQGAAGVALAAPLARGSLASGHGDRTIRIGLIGCGGRGTGAAAQALRTAGDVRLVAMGDAFTDRLESSLRHLQGQEDIAESITVADEYRFVGFDAFRGVLESDVDLVVLATPPHFRPEHFSAAIDAGKHVFMEKPVAVDGAGVRAVLAAADRATESGLAVGVGLQRRHDPGYREVIQRVQDGQIGDVVAARAYWNMGFLWHKARGSGWSDMEWQLRNWLYFTWLSGDHIVEQHIHNLDVVNWTKSAFPVRAWGAGGRQVRTDPKFGNIFDHHGVHFEYEDGSFMFSQCRQIDGCAGKVSEHLIGTKGRADFQRGYHIRGEENWRFEGKRGNPYQNEHDDLFAAIRAGEPYNEAHDGAKSTLTAVLGRMATYTGKVVKWEEAMASERLGPETYEWGDLPMPPVAQPGS